MIDEKIEIVYRMQTKLKLKLFFFIQDFEKKNQFEFEPFEVDYVLLDMIKDNHRGYIRFKYENGNEE